MTFHENRRFNTTDYTDFCPQNTQNSLFSIKNICSAQAGRTRHSLGETMKIEKCGSYHAKIEGCELVAMPDGKSAFKVYFVSIVGRDNPSRTEWALCGIDKQAFIKAFRESGQEGVGFLTAFPHITKVFRYAPKMEILQHVRAFDTKTFAPISLIRDDFVEFACLAEALLAADEYKAWAAAGSVEEYLRYVSPVENAPGFDNAKLKRYFSD